MRGADLVVLAVKAEAALATAEALADAIGETPVLSVASELRFTKARRLSRRRCALDRRANAGRCFARRSSRACTRSPPHRSRRAEADGDALVCGDDADAKELVLELAGRGRHGPRARRRAARERARARRDDGRDRQPEQALPGARGRSDHRPAVTIAAGFTVFPVTGIPELREGDDLAALIVERVELEDGDVVVVAQKAISKIEGRVVRLDDVEPSERAREIAGDEGDPQRVEWILREAKRVVRVRAPLVICETRHGFICASAGVDQSNTPEARDARAAAASIPTRRPSRCATRCASGPGATSACSSPTRSAARGARGRPTSRSAPPASRCCAS